MNKESILRRMITIIERQNFTKQELQHKLDIARMIYNRGYKKYELTITALEKCLKDA